MFNKGRWIAAFLSVSLITSMAPSAMLSAQEVTEEQEAAEEVTEESSVQEKDEESVSNEADSGIVAPDSEEETEEILAEIESLSDDDLTISSTKTFTV